MRPSSKVKVSVHGNRCDLQWQLPKVSKQLWSLIGTVTTAGHDSSGDAVRVVVRVCRGDEVHVSHTGSDQPGCGPSTQPCATLHHALSSHPNASHITVNSSGGAYLSEAGSQYLVIDHNVTLTGSGPGPAVIQCPDDQHSKLFYFVASSAGHHVVVSIEVSLSFSLSPYVSV